MVGTSDRASDRMALRITNLDFCSGQHVLVDGIRHCYLLFMVGSRIEVRRLVGRGLAFSYVVDMEELRVGRKCSWLHAWLAAWPADSRADLAGGTCRAAPT